MRVLVWNVARDDAHLPATRKAAFVAASAECSFDETLDDLVRVLDTAANPEEMRSNLAATFDVPEDIFASATGAGELDPKGARQYLEHLTDPRFRSIWDPIVDAWRAAQAKPATA